MTPAQIWLATAILLFILEIITPGFVLANFGVAALAAAVAAWMDASLTMQVIVFCIAAIISFVTVRPLLRRTVFRDAKKVRTGGEALVGRVGKVTDHIPTPPDAGRVQIDGDNWRAFSVHGQPIPSGATVRVIRVESASIHVEQI
jgi:membrane protein implicated in regulation of membrane protease activity